MEYEQENGAGTEDKSLNLKIEKREVGLVDPLSVFRIQFEKLH
jgi:hypothetical protein